MTVYQSNLVTSVLIVRIPTEGVEDFRAYEDAVLPLLPEFNGRLERRLRNQDGTIEIHIVSFASDADRQNYRNDPRRRAQSLVVGKIICEIGIASDVERLLTAQSGQADVAQCPLPLCTIVHRNAASTRSETKALTHADSAITCVISVIPPSAE